MNAAIRLQQRCSEKVGKDSNDLAISTRLLVSSSHIGCLIGKGGAVISEMRSVTRANIRILQKENVPKIAREDEEMVQVKHIFGLCLDLYFVFHCKTKPMFHFVVVRLQEILMPL